MASKKKSRKEIREEIEASVLAWSILEKKKIEALMTTMNKLTSMVSMSAIEPKLQRRSESLKRIGLRICEATTEQELAAVVQDLEYT